MLELINDQKHTAPLDIRILVIIFITIMMEGDVAALVAEYMQKNKEKTVMHNGLHTNLDYIKRVTDKVMNTMHRKPEAKMNEFEYNAKLQALADNKYFADEMAEQFSCAGSIRSAIAEEMTDAEIILLRSHPLVQKACQRHFTPIAWESALKRAELEMEETE